MLALWLAALQPHVVTGGGSGPAPAVVSGGGGPARTRRFLPHEDRTEAPRRRTKKRRLLVDMPDLAAVVDPFYDEDEDAIVMYLLESF